MQSSPKMLSVLFVAVSVVLPAIHALTVSGDYECSDFENYCDGATLDVPSGSNFSLKCRDKYSCYYSHIVVHSGSTLRRGGIECTERYSCESATIVVYDSNLATDANNYLHCGVNSRIACRRMNLTLVDSSIALYCDYDSCVYMEVHLFGSSTLELKQNSDTDFSLTIYLHDSSAQLIDNGVNEYTLLIAYTTSIPTTTSTPPTSTPRLSSTTMTSTTTPIPHTTTSIIPTPTIPTIHTTTSTVPTPTIPHSTQTPTIPTIRIPNTTATIPTSTISSTVVDSTRVYTTNATAKRTTTDSSTADPTEDGGNGGSNAGLNVIKTAAIGGGVGVLLLVCSFCLGVKYSDSRKQEQGEDEKDAKVQIALVPKTLPKDSGQQSNGSGYAAHVVMSTETEHTTKGRMSDADGDAVSSSDLSSEMMYMDMPKDYTPGGHLPHSPEGCQRQVEGGAYGIR